MKLMIDIPDNIYDAIKKVQTIIGGQRSGKTLLQILVNSVENGIPLDDVKAEMERANKMYPYTNHGILEAIDILDKYIGKESEDFPQAKDIEPTVKGFVDTMDILDRLFEESEDKG